MEETPYELDDKVDKMVGRVSLLISFLLATLGTVWYFQTHPPDSEELRRMRIFFRDNAIEVGEFMRMEYDEKEKYAEKAEHPFYKTYMKASENEKAKIRKIYHESIDYTPNQYWFNLVGLWLILFSTFWFIGLMVQGAVNLVRQKQIPL